MRVLRRSAIGNQKRASRLQHIPAWLKALRLKTSKRPTGLKDSCKYAHSVYTNVIHVVCCSFTNADGNCRKRH
eukprot:6479012-Amphidinium_carterae.1